MHENGPHGSPALNQNYLARCSFCRRAQRTAWAAIKNQFHSRHARCAKTGASNPPLQSLGSDKSSNKYTYNPAMGGSPAKRSRHASPLAPQKRSHPRDSCRCHRGPHVETHGSTACAPEASKPATIGESGSTDGTVGGSFYYGF